MAINENVPPLMQKKSFIRTGEGATINVDWFDISSGSGYVLFYAGNADDKYLLSENPFYSENILTATDAGNADYAKTHDIDFDILFNLPKTIRGHVIVSVPFGISNTSTGQFYYTYFVVRVRKWDGTTETEIANNTGKIASMGTNNADEVLYGRDTIYVDTPLTDYKSGEYLRITIEQWTKSAATGRFMVGHDPQNRTEQIWVINNDSVSDPSTNFAITTNAHGTGSSLLTCYVPFRIEL